MGEIAYVLVESGDPDACALLDVFHIYTGGYLMRDCGSFVGLRCPCFT